MAQDLLGINAASVNAQSQAQQKFLEDLQSRIAAEGKKGATPEEIDRVAKEFEAVFVQEMLKHLFEGTEPDPLFGGGSAENIYRGMLLEEYGKAITERGGLGIADHVKRTMLQMQEVSDHDNDSNNKR